MINLTGRRCWIKYFRIPVHAWEPRLFHKIAAALGSLIKCDCHTSDKCVYDFKRLLISTKESFPIIKSLNILSNISLSESCSEDSSPKSNEDSFVPDTEDGEARNLEALSIGSNDIVHGGSQNPKVLRGVCCVSGINIYLLKNPTGRLKGRWGFKANGERKNGTVKSSMSMHLVTIEKRKNYGLSF
ncbi:hypothetical protein DH2020_002410 [Rehmannia glutinosa]|uniref:DUF4283 domain-containing protein n=1 Tax=Rehmannia glutinosa TaxID=99300 RepID=A0ABR0XUB2_REHGL